MVLAAGLETGVEPNDIVVIGDTSFDMAMATAAGARGIGVTWGYHQDAALSEAGAVALVRNFAELASWIDAHVD